MKKIYRRTQMGKVLGPPLWGVDFYKYGLPYVGAGGCIFAHKTDIVDTMFMVVENHPKLHIVSTMKDGRVLNRYDENAREYYLHFGNADPEIEFSTECSEEDISDEEWTRFQNMIQDSAAQIQKALEPAARRWVLNSIRK